MSKDEVDLILSEKFDRKCILSEFESYFRYMIGSIRIEVHINDLIFRDNRNRKYYILYENLGLINISRIPYKDSTLDIIKFIGIFGDQVRIFSDSDVIEYKESPYEKTS